LKKSTIGIQEEQSVVSPKPKFKDVKFGALIEKHGEEYFVDDLIAP